MTDTRNSPTDEAADGFSPEEREAMKERARELKAASRKSRGSKIDGEKDVLAKIAELDGTDRAIAQRLHEIVAETAPQLAPKTWYGMPGYAKDGKIVVFLQAAGKFKTRYATLGFNDLATLDDGPMWATSFAITSLTSEVERRIVDLIRKAVD